MPPRGSKKVKVEEATQQPAIAAAQVSDEQAGSINATHYAQVQEAVNCIINAPGLQDVRTKKTLTLDAGARLAPYSKEQMNANIERHEIYMCGANIFHTNVLQGPSPGVPLDTIDIKRYTDHFFADIDSISKLPHIDIGCDTGGMSMQRTSPSEPLHALLFRVCGRRRRGCQPYR